MIAKDLTQEFVCEIKNRILEEKYKIGECLPTLRELAEEFGCSRSVINVGIAKLQAQGYLLIRKRQNTIINDFLTKGSLDIIEDMTHCKNDKIKKMSISDMLSARMLIEIESVKFASKMNNPEEIRKLEEIIEEEEKLIKDKEENFETIALCDAKFHIQIIKMGSNIIFSLIMNALQEIAFDMTKKFYYNNTKIYEKYVESHKEILQQVKNKDAKKAMILLKNILKDGEVKYKKINNIT